MSRASSFGFAAACLLAACTSTAQPRPPLAIADVIDAFVEGALAEIGSQAGVAVALYTPQGTYARGFGYADIEAGEPATSETAFYIASSTKSFAALTLNVLHHRGEIDLDSTLADFAPGAPFPAEVNADRVTLRELLTHTSGIANDPIMFRSAFSGEHSPDLLWELLSASAINQGAPHETFQYTNTGYNILTVLTDRELGVPWQDLIAREIVAPAGMTRTTAYMSGARNGGWSVARPYGPDFETGGMHPLYLEKVDATMQSAGGMVMSAEDALLWLELLIEDGRIDGEQIIPAETVRETRARFAHVDLQFGPYLREDYGLGWYISSYGGDLMIHHFGGFTGFRAHVSYLPERRIGVAVFVNERVAGQTVADATANFIYDWLAGRVEESGGLDVAIEAVGERSRQIAKALQADYDQRAEREWVLSLPREAYAGVYESPEGGVLEIALEGRDLVARIGVLRATAEPFTQPDTIRLELAPLSGDVVGFDIDDGVVVAAQFLGMSLGRFTRRY